MSRFPFSIRSSIVAALILSLTAGIDGPLFAAATVHPGCNVLPAQTLLPSYQAIRRTSQTVCWAKTTSTGQCLTLAEQRFTDEGDGEESVLPSEITTVTIARAALHPVQPAVLQVSVSPSLVALHTRLNC